MEYENEDSFYPPPYKIKAFTLAEVLITLVIIGVIAAITVPSLMNNTNGQEYRSMLKKAISAVNQALELHYALEGVGAQDYDNETNLINNLFAKRMNILEINPSTEPQQRQRQTRMSDGNGDDSTFGTYVVSSQDGDFCAPTANGSYRNFFITQDGVLFCIQYWDNGSGTYASNFPENEKPCNSYNTKPCCSAWDDVANLYIDINGLKKPNKATTSASRPRDQYTAQIYNQKVVPFGEATQEIMYGKSVSK